VHLGWPVFIEAKDDGGGGDNWTTGDVSRAKLQSNNHHQQTNIVFFTGRMTFLSPNQQCQSTEGKKAYNQHFIKMSQPDHGLQHHGLQHQVHEYRHTQGMRVVSLS